jgi:hypothetical protein
VLLLACAFALAPGFARAEAKHGCTMLDQHRTVHVELSASEPERTYCVHLEKGQHLLAEITNAQGVDPSGRVISPAGGMDGGPGGPFYRGEIRESGIYQIQVGQRGTKRAGSCDLSIKLTPGR